MAAIGRQLKQSVKVFHSFMLNLRLPGGTHNHTRLEAVCAFAFLLFGFTSLTLVVETVDAIDGGALVVAPEQEEVLWIFDLIGQ